MDGSPTRRFRIIGLGRAGRSVLGALEGTSWICAGGLGRGDDPAAAASGVDAVVLAVPDDAIAAVAQAVRPAEAVLIHLSGAKALDVLAPHSLRASVHPLVSLPDSEIGAARLRGGASYAIAGHPLAAELVSALNGRAIEVPDHNRPLYHAAAAVAANHLVVLCAQVERIADRIGVPVSLYWELMATTLENVQRMGPGKALTGPGARGDTTTVEVHIDALAALGPDEAALYRTLAAEARRLGREPT